MKNFKSIRDLINDFKNGKYNSDNIETQISAGWFEWFCDDCDLLVKTHEFCSILCTLNESSKINLDKWYVYFKNICPLKGSLYDEIRFAVIETKEIIYIIQIDFECNKSKFVVLGKKDERMIIPDKVLYETNSKEELVFWMNN